MTLPACCYAPLLLSAGACYISISLSSGALSSEPAAAAAAVDRWDRQTDGRMLNRIMGPAPCTMWAASKKLMVRSVFTHALIHTSNLCQRLLETSAVHYLVCEIKKINPNVV